MSVTRRQLLWVARVIEAIEGVENSGGYLMGPITLAAGDGEGGSVPLGQLVQKDDVWAFTTEGPL